MKENDMRRAEGKAQAAEKSKEKIGGQIDKILSGIDGPNREHVAKYRQSMEAKKLSPSVILSGVYEMARWSRLLGKSFLEAGRDDLIACLNRLQSDPGVWLSGKMGADASINKSKLYLKMFFKWLYNRNRPSWFPEEEFRQKSIGFISAEDILTPQEVRAMAEGCKLMGRALIWVAFESGARLNELRWLKKSDVTFDKYGARMILTTEKTKKSKPQTREVRLVFSAPALRDWFDVIEKDDSFDYVWISTIGGKHGTIIGDEYMRKIPKRAAERADIKKVVWFHLLRHSAAAYDKARGMPHHIANSKYGWAKQSNMYLRYGELTRGQVDDYILSLNGVKREEKRDKGVSTIACHNCGTSNTPGRSCYACGADLTAGTDEAEAKELLNYAIKNPRFLDMMREIAKEKARAEEHNKHAD